MSLRTLSTGWPCPHKNDVSWTSSTLPMVRSLIARIRTLVRRKQKARSLGFTFNRSATFTLPDQIIVTDRTIELHLPNEHGVRIAFIDILLDDCYRCTSLLKNGGSIRTILDIGGNVGLFGLHARNVFKDAIVHVYEPNPLLHAFLSKHAASARFEYFLEAVGISSGHVSVKFDRESVLTRTQSDANGSVPQISFRQAIDRLGGVIDLLKLDCEGEEWELFKDKDSWRYVKNLSMEYHLFESWQTEQHVRNALTDLGFFITSFRPGRNFGLITATRHSFA